MTVRSNEGDGLDRTRRPFTLSWSAIKCGRCGTQRPRALPCPDCGGEPENHEVDPDRQRRQQIATSALALLDINAPGPTPVPSADVRHELCGLLHRISGVTRTVLDDLQQVLVDDSRTERLHTTATELGEIASAVRHLPLHRPWTRIVRTLDAVASELVAAVRGFLEAVAADTPIEAQHAARTGQQHLDKLSLCADELDDSHAVLDAAESPVLDVMAQFVTLASQVTGSTDPLVWEAHGWSVIETLIDEPLPHHSGIGIQLLGLALPTRMVFDEASFNEAVKTSYAAFRSTPDRLAALLEDPHIRADLADAHDHMVSGALIATTLLAASLPDHANLTALLDLSRTLTESLGKRLVAALRAVQTNKPYSTHRTKDISSTLPAARTARFGTAVDGIDLALRHASAHQEFRWDNDSVVLSPSTPRPIRLTYAELLDHHIAGIEAMHANYIGLIAAAAQSNADLSDPRGLELLGLDIRQLIEAGLRIWGWTIHAIVLDDSTLSIEATLPHDAKVITAIGVITPYLPDDVHTVELTLTHHDEHRHHLEGPLAPWNTHNNPGSDKALALVDLLGSLRLDDRPAMPQAVHRRLIATWTSSAMRQDLPVAIPRLRRLRQSAQLVGDDELDTVIRGVIVAVRHRLDHAMLDPTSAADLPRLLKWMGTPAPDPTAFTDTLDALTALQNTPVE